MNHLGSNESLNILWSVSENEEEVMDSTNNKAME